MSEFKSVIETELEKSVEFLSENWLDECVRIIRENKDNIEKNTNKNSEVIESI
jgi:hypothetical protein